MELVFFHDASEPLSPRPPLASALTSRPRRHPLHHLTKTRSTLHTQRTRTLTQRIFSIAFSVIGCMCARRARTPSNLDPHGQCACTQMLVPRPGTGRPRSFASHIVLSRALAAADFDRYMLAAQTRTSDFERSRCFPGDCVERFEKVWCVHVCCENEAGVMCARCEVFDWCDRLRVLVCCQRLCVRKLYKPQGRVSSRLVARRSAAVQRWTLGHIGGTVRTHTDCHTLTGGSVIWMPVGLALPLGEVRTIG